MTWKTDFERDMMKSMPVPPVQLVRGEGVWVWDSSGKKYLDFLSGIAVNSLGHAHPVVVEALQTQASQLLHVSNIFTNQPVLAAAAVLKKLAGTGESGRVFFCNSGTEANEAALKLARKHRPEGTIVTIEKSFHGRTTGALGLTGKPAMREGFGPLVPNIEHIAPTLEALEASISDNTAALFVEPIRGEAGVEPLPEGFLVRARELTQQHGALLIIDEVQTGAGRTGEWFGFQASGITPDAITLAKGIGGGFPVGAMLTFGAASDLFSYGDHGTTFGGNALAAAVVSAVMGELQGSDALSNVRAREQQLRQGIAAFDSPLVAGIRGAGLLLGVELKKPLAQEIVNAALELGLIINAPAPDIVRLLPPLNLSEAETAEFLKLFEQALAAVVEMQKGKNDN